MAGPDARSLHAHLTAALLPWWRDHGVDVRRGGFVSRLDAAGAAVDDRERRLLVQTRQLYVFSEGALRGVEGARAVAEAALEHLLRVWHDERHGGFFHTATPEGEPLDRRKDCYGHAFAVFALAHAHRATGDARALALARETATLATGALRDAEHGGYLESAGEDWVPQRGGARRQNPHMHWLEALLALHEEVADPALLAEARALVALLEDRFLDPKAGCLLEHFEADWSPRGGAEGAVVEPGHHYEWVWLLSRMRRATGEPDRDLVADSLFRFAETKGVDEDGGVFDEIGSDGRVLRDTKRLWPQTERLKALAVRGDRAALSAALGRCLEVYATAHGPWREHLDRGGRPVTELHNATSVYHVVLALTEALDALEGG